MFLSGCSRPEPPAPTKAEVSKDPAVFDVGNPALFKTVKVETRSLPRELSVNGSVFPDVNKTIHVTSLGSGRVVEIRAKIGDNVKKGQVLLVISSPDLQSAASDYRKAVADEVLSKKALDRAQLLYSHGAMAQKDLEAAQDVEDKAKVDLQTAAEHVRVLGGSTDSPNPLILLRAPVSGTIVEQNVSGAEGIKTLDNTPNLFTIADLSDVWILCDVFENDLDAVHVGDSAQITFNAYPDRQVTGRIADISKILDPNTRSAKVRVVLSNLHGEYRPGMFAIAKFRSRGLHEVTVVPATAIMRLQDKDWVFRKEGDKRFRRIEVHSGGPAPGDMQQVTGLDPGAEIVANALEFSTAVVENQ